MTRDIIYATHDQTALKAVVHTPDAALRGQPRPAIVFFFGGGWQGGELGQFEPQCERLAQLGMIAVRGEYRVSSRHHTTPFESMADARALVSYLRRHAGELGIDPTRLAAGGGSAGGHLAACSAVLPGEDAPNCLPDALVLFNPVLDTGPGGFGFDRFGDRFREASPLHNVRPGLPLTLIMHGTDDTVVPVANARDYRDAMRASGNHCELIEYAGAGHGFFNPNQHDGQYFEKTLKASEDFLRSLGWLPELASKHGVEAE